MQQTKRVGVTKGYIAPATIVNGAVKVNHIICVNGTEVCSVLPFDGEVANTAYMDGVIIVSSSGLLDYLDALRVVSTSVYQDGVIVAANELCNYIITNGWGDMISKIDTSKVLLYVNMVDGDIENLL